MLWACVGNGLLPLFAEYTAQNLFISSISMYSILIYPLRNERIFLLKQRAVCILIVCIFRKFYGMPKLSWKSEYVSSSSGDEYFDIDMGNALETMEDDVLKTSGTEKYKSVPGMQNRIWVVYDYLWQAWTRLTANKYFSARYSHKDKYHIFDDICALMIKESSLDNNIHNTKSSAIWLWQMMKWAKIETMRFLKEHMWVEKEYDLKDPVDNCILSIIYYNIVIPYQFSVAASRPTMEEVFVTEDVFMFQRAMYNLWAWAMRGLVDTYRRDTWDSKKISWNGFVKRLVNKIPNVQFDENNSTENKIYNINYLDAFGWKAKNVIEMKKSIKYRKENPAHWEEESGKITYSKVVEFIDYAYIIGALQKWKFINKPHSFWVIEEKRETENVPVSSSDISGNMPKKIEPKVLVGEGLWEKQLVKKESGKKYISINEKKKQEKPTQNGKAKEKKTKEKHTGETYGRQLEEKIESWYKTRTYKVRAGMTEDEIIEEQNYMRNMLEEWWALFDDRSKTIFREWIPVFTMTVWKEYSFIKAPFIKESYTPKGRRKVTFIQWYTGEIPNSSWPNLSLDHYNVWYALKLWETQNGYMVDELVTKINESFDTDVILVDVYGFPFSQSQLDEKLFSFDELIFFAEK